MSGITAEAYLAFVKSVEGFVEGSERGTYWLKVTSVYLGGILKPLRLSVHEKAELELKKLKEWYPLLSRKVYPNDI